MSLTLSAKPTPAVSLRDSGLAGYTVAMLRRLGQWRAERRAARQLSQYPDALLKDMGITRADIPGAVRYGRTNTYDIDVGNNVR